MKYCPVMPPATIRLLDDYKGDIGYFAFADIAYASDQYLDWFKGRPDIVLDCPIVEVAKGEPGALLSPSQLVNVVREMKPKFTIIPDERFDRHKTMSMFRDYCERIADPSMTGVLQGRSAEELVQCALEMYDYGVRQLAIPRLSKNNAVVSGSDKLATRSAIIRRVMTERDVREWHLLGASWPYNDERYCAREALAYSCDTAEPVNAALVRGVITAKTTKRPEGFREITELRKSWLHYNVKEMEEWLLSSPATTEESEDSAGRKPKS